MFLYIDDKKIAEVLKDLHAKKAKQEMIFQSNQLKKT